MKVLCNGVEVPREQFDLYKRIGFDTEGNVLVDLKTSRDLELDELPILQAEMDAISQDIIQMMCGAVFTDKEERLEKFRKAHNRFREITGKEPRIYLKNE